jgi:hypothetical protein
MLRKIYLFVLILACSIPMSVIAETQLQTVQYWLDNDFAGRTSQSVTSETAILTNLPLPVSLSEGFHTVHIRAKDDNSTWSVVHSQVIYKLQTYAGSNSVESYEYWWDNDFTNRVSTNISGSTVIINQPLTPPAATEGMSVLHFRTRDTAGQWSGVNSQSFYANRIIPEGSNKIDAYRFWYDNQFETNEFVALSEAVNPYELDTEQVLPATFNEGEEHTFHIQFRDLSGQWSAAPVDTFLIAIPTGILKIGADDVQIYPNPVQEGFYVQGISAPAAKLTLSDLNGRIIFSKPVSDKEYISIATLPGGVYVAKLTLATGVVNLKIIKK